MRKARDILARRESLEPKTPKISQNNSIVNIKTENLGMPLKPISSSQTPKNAELKVVIKCEQKIELAKINLAKREDFNVFR